MLAYLVTPQGSTTLLHLNLRKSHCLVATDLHGLLQGKKERAPQQTRHSQRSKGSKEGRRITVKRLD